MGLYNLLNHIESLNFIIIIFFPFPRLWIYVDLCPFRAHVEVPYVMNDYLSRDMEGEGPEDSEIEKNQYLCILSWRTGFPKYL